MRMPSTVLDIAFKTSSGSPPILTAINEVVSSVIPNLLSDSAICWEEELTKQTNKKERRGKNKLKCYLGCHRLVIDHPYVVATAR